MTDTQLAILIAAQWAKADGQDVSNPEVCQAYILQALAWVQGAAVAAQ